MKRLIPLLITLIVLGCATPHSAYNLKNQVDEAKDNFAQICKDNPSIKLSNTQAIVHCTSETDCKVAQIQMICLEGEVVGGMNVIQVNPTEQGTKDDGKRKLQPGEIEV